MDRLTDHSIHIFASSLYLHQMGQIQGARTLRDHYMGGYTLSSLGSYYNQLKIARHYHSLGDED